MRTVEVNSKLLFFSWLDSLGISCVGFRLGANACGLRAVEARQTWRPLKSIWILGQCRKTGKDAETVVEGLSPSEVAVFVMRAQPQVASYRGGYRKRLMLLLQARQEITKPCQLVTHATTTATDTYIHAQMDKYVINYINTKMQTRHQRLFLLSVLMSHSLWSPFVRLLHNCGCFSACGVL